MCQRPLTGLACALLLGSGALSQAAPEAPPPAPPPVVFDETTLEALLQGIELLNESLQHGLDDSTGRLAERLPEMWRKLEGVERQLRHQLPLLREQLRQIERMMREYAPDRPPPRKPTDEQPLIAV